MAGTTDPQPPGRGKLVALTVILTTLFWTVVWGGFTLARGRPQQIAFAVQPPPATATPAPSSTPTPTTEPTATTSPSATAAPSVTAAARAGVVVLETGEEDNAPAASGSDRIPASTDEITGAVPTNSAASTLININTASAVDLETLPGIGPKTAEAIIAYRDANGPFATIEAITEVKGIGPATLEKLRTLITVN